MFAFVKSFACSGSERLFASGMKSAIVDVVEDEWSGLALKDR